MVDNRLFQITLFDSIKKENFGLNSIFNVFDKTFIKLHKKVVDNVFTNIFWNLDECFMPIILATKLSDMYNPTSVEQFVENSLLIHSLTPLKYNKKVHIVADEILNNLNEKSLGTDIPVDELSKIKDYSIFIDFSKNQTKIKYLDYYIYAVDFCIGDVLHTLSIYYYVNDTLMVDIIPFALDHYKLYDNIVDYLKNLYTLLKNGYNDSVLSTIITLISIILYISTEEDDCYIDNNKYIYKNNKYIKDNKRAFILYPDDKVKNLKIGFDTEKKIKEYNEIIIRELKDTERRKIKAHIRKGHIHSYWTGKRNDKDNRKLIFKYLKPVLVMGTKEIENE